MLVTFKNGAMHLNGLIVMYQSPGKLTDRNGMDITGAVIEADLDTGRVVYRTHILPRFNLITKKDTRQTFFAPPLKLVDAIGRSWEGKKQ